MSATRPRCRIPSRTAHTYPTFSPARWSPHSFSPLARRGKVSKAIVAAVLPEVEQLCSGRNLDVDEDTIRDLVHDEVRNDEEFFHHVLGGGNVATVSDPIDNEMNSGGGLVLDLIEFNGVAYTYEIDLEGMEDMWSLRYAYRVGDEVEYKQFTNFAISWLATFYASHATYTGDRFPDVDRDLVRAGAESPFDLGHLRRFIADLEDYGFDDWDDVAATFARERNVSLSDAREAVRNLQDAEVSDDVAAELVWWIFEEHVRW